MPVCFLVLSVDCLCWACSFDLRIARMLMVGLKFAGFVCYVCAICFVCWLLVIVPTFVLLCLWLVFACLVYFVFLSSVFYLIGCGCLGCVIVLDCLILVLCGGLMPCLQLICVYLVND